MIRARTICRRKRSAYRPSSASSKTRRRRRIANAAPPFDGVFLPDAADRLNLLISYLTFVDIRGVLLLGASGWDRPQELLAVGPPVNGGVFVDGFFLYSFRPEVRAFVDAYRDAYHADPGTLEAYGYDAAMLLREFIAAGAVTRQMMLAEFRRPFSRHGATAETRRHRRRAHRERAVSFEGRRRRHSRIATRRRAIAGSTAPSGSSRGPNGMRGHAESQLPTAARIAPVAAIGPAEQSAGCVSEIGEFGFLERLRPARLPRRDVELGIGDDCAVVRAGDAGCC